MNKSVCIIGGGISGLCTAYHLQKRGADVTVVEKASEVGGNIRSTREAGYLVEIGPNSLLISPECYALIRELGLEAQIVTANPSAKTRYILKNGRLSALPTGPFDLFTTKTFSTKAKLRLFKEPFVGKGIAEDESVADFFRRRLGSEIVEYAVDPFISGIFAGNPEKLSIRNAFPKLFAMERDHGGLLKGGIRTPKKNSANGSVPKEITRTISFKDGMQTLPYAIAKTLGSNVRTNVTVNDIRRTENGRFILETEGSTLDSREFDAVVISSPAHVAASILNGIDRPLAEDLSGIYYPPVAVVSAAFNSSDLSVPLEGFGFLVPRSENRRILGCLWPSAVFDGRAPKGVGLTTTFIGGSRQAELVDLSDTELIDLAMNEIASILGITAEPLFIKLKKWPRAIPQYNLGYESVINAIERFHAANPGMYLSGNYYNGISVGECIKNGAKTANAVAQFLQIDNE